MKPLILALLSVCWLTSFQELKAERAPKLLLVDIDDVGHDLIEQSRTPNLDALGREGRAFTRFVTAPVCSPTRAMVLMGARPAHPDVRMGGIVNRSSKHALPVEPLISLPQLLGDANIQSAKIGKWHLAPPAETNHPNRIGFTTYAGVPSNVSRRGDSYTHYVKVEDQRRRRVQGTYLTTDETDDAIRCVQSAVPFISLSYHAVHIPLHVPPAELHSGPDPTTEAEMARAMLEACDTELGRLLAAARQADYTVIVFSDNGSAKALGGGKGSLSEAGVVCPLWAIGPGIEPGLDHSTVSATDLYATVAEHFGLDTSASALRGPHSTSFLAALRGERMAPRWALTEQFRGVGEDPRTSGHQWRRLALSGALTVRVHDPEVGDVSVTWRAGRGAPPIELLSARFGARLARALSRALAAAAG